MTELRPSNDAQQRLSISPLEFQIQIFCIFAIAWISMKISLPALVTLERQFGVSSSAMKFVVLAFFVSYGASIMLWGTLSDLLLSLIHI